MIWPHSELKPETEIRISFSSFLTLLINAIHTEDATLVSESISHNTNVSPRRPTGYGVHLPKKSGEPPAKQEFSATNSYNKPSLSANLIISRRAIVIDNQTIKPVISQQGKIVEID
jgi:hypothetical protein